MSSFTSSETPTQGLTHGNSPPMPNFNSEIVTIGYKVVVRTVPGLASRALPEMVGIWLFDRVPRFAFPTF